MHVSFFPVLAALASACGPRGGAGAGQGAGAESGGSRPGAADAAHNLLKQSGFDDGVMLPWAQSFSAPAAGAVEVKGAALCLRIDNPGANRWDAQVRHREMVLQSGHSYTLSFKAWATRATKMTGKVGMAGPPYTDYWTSPVDVSTEPRTYSFAFQMEKPDDPTAELAFHAGGDMVQGAAPITICFDDVVLSDPTFTSPPPAPRVVIPDIRVNQVGYFPKFAKVAVWVSRSASPADWQLLDAAGKTLMRGKTAVVGPDAASGDALHRIDFSAFTTPGKGYVLRVADSKSDPFDIGSDVYKKLKYDALAYFYHNRSGIEIKMPFADGAQWARPAGHPSDKAPCARDAGCDYTLDVTGGWYDAGDHGKYVVNGGISLWTLLNWHERARARKGAVDLFADRKGNLPESGNKVPDILDEVRWEMEFLLRMQVPDGQPLAGMAHHKIHDEDWTGLATPPHEDPKKRHLRPPSTTATLNLAATAAQAARIWKRIDPAFSARCRKAAERAWAAARKNPDKLPPAEDSKGGGPYDDKDASDEFYWAAAELFITTGKPEYRAALTSSPLDGRVELREGTAMTWQRVDMLGRISLAIVPHRLPAARYRDQIKKLADGFVADARAEGYGVPFRPIDGKAYPWGSNSFVLNNALVVAVAHDLAPRPEYLETVVAGMDVILGRNAMGKCYVTGYGARPLQNPHHRFWSFQAKASLPRPPPGAVSGGPNSGLQDPYAQAAGLKGCKPAKCFVDNIESWSTNEITINWNAPLTWLSAWLDEQARQAR